MAKISKLKPFGASGTEYDLKDADAFHSDDFGTISVSDDDSFPFYDRSQTRNVSITFTALKDRLYDFFKIKFYDTTAINENTIADDDKVPFFDTSVDFRRNTTWSNIKSVLKTYFDQYYNNYTLPTASTSTLGGVKVDGTTVTIDANGVISSSGGGGGSSVSVSHTGTASSTGIRKQIITVDNVSYDIDGTAYMEQQVTLSTSVDTVVTFTNAAINLTSEITVGTSKYGICPIDVDAETAGTCTVTFAKVDSATTITVRICLR